MTENFRFTVYFTSSIALGGRRGHDRALQSVRDKHQFAGEKILVTEKSQARLDAPGIYVLYSSAQVRAHLTAFCQPWSSCSRRESSMAGVNTFSMAQLFFTSSRLLQ